MVELIAAGPKPTQKWRHPVPAGQVIRLGRAPKSPDGWGVPWDWLISREHADLTLKNGRLEVRCLDSARNPIYYKEQATSKFSIAIGDEFRIGTTLFRLDGDPGEEEIDSEWMEDTPSVFEDSFDKRIFPSDELRRFPFGDADARLEALSRLPSVIAVARSDEDFAARLVELLLQAVPRAEAAAVIRCDDQSLTGMSRPDVIRWGTRSEKGSGFRPSKRLIETAHKQGTSRLHVWANADETDEGFSVSANLDWAICTPIKTRSGVRWCLYLSGAFGGSLGSGSIHSYDEDLLKGDVRFAELMAQFIAAIRQVRRLESDQRGLSHFVSPAVMEALTDARADSILEPKESEITVLFCDMRGFSKKTEQAQQDLRELLDRVSNALGVMTRSILRHDGVIADFQGDAALGFFGWPFPAQDGPLPGCRAALAIRREFANTVSQKNSPLADFRVGVGVAHGRAIAGRIGTDDQVKVGAFGPVVNIGSRLEGMTKHVRVPILLDETTASYVRTHMPRSEGRVRKLGRVRPYGMDNDLMVSELLPPLDEAPEISDEHIEAFEAAVDTLMEGRWQETLKYLDDLPASDKAKHFLMIFIALNDYEPPPDWDGVVPLINK